MTMADFAKAQLMKFGWTEGKGLGKNENGITEALRPNLKFDTAGIGHKHTDTNAWWESEFNKAAKSINVESRCNGVTISSMCEAEETDVPSNGRDTKEESAGFKQYANFLKTSTLCNGTLIHEPGSDFTKIGERSDEIVHVCLTDEELFKACGGRTAHKGARHGLKLNGKLERIAQQEKELLSNSNNKVSANCIDVSLTVKSKKSMKIRTEVEHDVIEELYDDHDCETHSNASAILSLAPSEAIYQFPRLKSSRKQQKKRIANLMHQLSMSCNISETDLNCETTISDTTDTKKCLKRKRNKDRRAHAEANLNKDALSEEIDDKLPHTPLPLSIEIGKDKKKKLKGQKHAMKLESKKAKKQKIGEIDIDCTQLDNEEEFVLPLKRAKKLHKKVVDLTGKLNTFSLNEEEADTMESKKSKKKNKKKANNHKLKSKVSKKEKGHHKKEAMKLERLTNKLMIKSCVPTLRGKTWKTAKTEQKLDSIVKNLMAVNITENVSDSMASHTKKKNKQKKKSKNKSKDKDVNNETVI